jgi:vacuolar-type H+-ATPase subunit E/Vma4
MSATALFATMTRQVEAESADHLAKARADAERILADARAKAAASREATLAAARAEVDRLDTLWKQKAQAESTRLELAMENDAVEAVLAKVREDVTRLAAGAEFQQILSRLLEQLMPAISGEKDVELLGDEKQLAHIRQWLSSHGHGSLDVKASGQFWDGVAAQDRRQTWRVSNTLRGRFERLEQAARKHCMTALFGTRGR